MDRKIDDYAWGFTTDKRYRRYVSIKEREGELTQRRKNIYSSQ